MNYLKNIAKQNKTTNRIISQTAVTRLVASVNVDMVGLDATVPRALLASSDPSAGLVGARWPDLRVVREECAPVIRGENALVR